MKKVMNANTPRLCPRGPPATGVDARADHREEGETTGHGVLVQAGRGGQHRQPDGGQQRGRDGLPPHGGVRDREQGEQRGQPSGDGADQGVARETAHDDRETDAEHGPRGEAQPRPSRVRRHEHPLQHGFPPPAPYGTRKAPRGSAAPSTPP
ncbi:hypothetical protein GCM10020295_09850 [Streptomyces cinereospinus]